MKEIEEELKRFSDATKFYEKYVLLKHRLLNYEYEHWAAGFVHGNNHGPGHISRVLDNLEHLVGRNCLAQGILTSYELFLAMMSILYHDVGILGGRSSHADRSAKFFDDESDTYIFDERDKRIIRAAVVSHSSSKDIEDECREFSETEYIGSQTVRPRVVAALVRLADELDEDFRRADPKVATRIGIKDDSLFYWRFCQCILAIRPDQKSLEIVVNVRFDYDDVGRIVRLDGVPRLFISAFADKVEKINRERRLLIRFLPEDLRYRRLLVTVKPLAEHATWKQPREFVFNDNLSASELSKAIPELSAEPAYKWLQDILENIRREELDSADAGLQRLEGILSELPTDIRMQVLWDRSIVWSLRAEKHPPNSDARAVGLNEALKYLERWYEFGLASGWRELGRTVANEVYRISTEQEMKFLFANKQKAIEELLRENRRLLWHTKSGGGGGCIAKGVQIEIPGGSVAIENLCVGTTIMSATLEHPPRRIETKVVDVIQSEQEICIRVNNRFLFTPSQPLYVNGTWVPVRELAIGAQLNTAEGTLEPISSLEQVPVEGPVYSLTTDHETHNFLVGSLICGNSVRKEMV